MRQLSIFLLIYLLACSAASAEIVGPDPITFPVIPLPLKNINNNTNAITPKTTVLTTQGFFLIIERSKGKNHGRLYISQSAYGP